ncbi:GNAT family N-acetyltransferase [Achromobacter sp. NPDC058515]|uniref:GNAT family N-acetyltransferase n=1 Tax=Achromobacter sp. NPDC058515 TaxID=3346533 RepID=UPI003665CF79
MELRHIDRNGLGELLSLYAHLHDTDDPLPDASQVGAVWEELMANPRCRHVGAYEQDQLLASCTITVIPNLTRGCRPYGVIENVVTHRAHRGRGYGKAVLKGALEFAWSMRCYKVMLMTGRKDQATLDFYAGAGFSGDEKRAFIAKPGAFCA